MHANSCSRHWADGAPAKRQKTDADAAGAKAVKKTKAGKKDKAGKKARARQEPQHVGDDDVVKDITDWSSDDE